MRSVSILTIFLFSYVLYDSSILRRYSSVTGSSFIKLELNHQDEKNKKKEKRYKNRKYIKKTRFTNKRKYKFSGTGSKDSRYSNQRKLRRMYRNG